MSFKRVGDDPTALRIQKRQRVSELLLEEIPEDEATLTKNGRFACLVCKHCPVFDTVAVLRIHRQGKKHFSYAKIRLEKLMEDAEIRQKREHMKYMEKVMDDANEDESPLLKITQQKKELALQGSKSSIKHEERKERTSKQLPFFQRRKPIDLDICNDKPGYKHVQRTESSKNLSNSVKDSESNHFEKTEQSMKPSIDTPGPKSQKKTPLSPGELARRKHFSRLRQAGWIMGLDGKWQKDENAEFDSDEDEPPPPPPSYDLTST